MIAITSDVNVTPFDAWSIYTSMTLHFRKDSAYDAFKFNFKGPRCKRETFMSHKHRYVFERISRSYPRKNLAIEFFLSNILEGNNWIGSMTDEAYVRWQGRVQRMDYDFQNVMSGYANLGLTFDRILIPESSGEMPIIYKQYTLGKVPIESLVILDYLVNFTSSINKFVSDPLDLVSDITYHISRYKPFLKSKMDLIKAKQNILNLFTYVNK